MSKFDHKRICKGCEFYKNIDNRFIVPTQRSLNYMNMRIRLILITGIA